jgi:exonuclease VII small subunit
MRVRISYGANIDDLPKITEDLLSNTIKQLWNCVETLERSLEELQDSEKDYESTITIINKTRIKLSNVDLSLADITAILDGLNNYHEGVKDVSERRPIVDPGGNTVDETEDSREG